VEIGEGKEDRDGCRLEWSMMTLDFKILAHRYPEFAVSFWFLGIFYLIALLPHHGSTHSSLYLYEMVDWMGGKT